MLKPIINRLKKLSWIPIQRVLLVTVWSVVTECSGNVIGGRQVSNPVGRDLTKGSWLLTLLWKQKALNPGGHVSQLEKTPYNIWSCTDPGDFWVKPTKKRSWHHCRLLPPKMPGQDFILQLNMNLPSLFTLALNRKLAPLSICPWPLLRDGQRFRLMDLLWPVHDATDALVLSVTSFSSIPHITMNYNWPPLEVRVWLLQLEYPVPCFYLSTVITRVSN